MRVSRWLVAASLGLASITFIGCEGEQPNSQTEPVGSRGARALEAVEKDLKPPVVVKPDLPPSTFQETATP